MRALAWEFPDEPNLANADRQFLLGPSLVSIISKSAAPRSADNFVTVQSCDFEVVNIENVTDAILTTCSDDHAGVDAAGHQRQGRLSGRGSRNRLVRLV